MKKASALTVALILASLASPFSKAAVIPFGAAIQRSIQVLRPDGKVESEQLVTEFHIRSSNGSSYQETTGIEVVSGRELDRSRAIENTQLGQSYIINERLKLVLVRPPMMRGPSSARPYAPALERKTLLGRTCVVFRDGNGELWFDEELRLLMFRRTETQLPGGKKMIHTSTVTRLTAGREPDPKLFTPSLEGYKVESPWK
jgi:hypothetical protein